MFNKEARLSQEEVPHGPGCLMLPGPGPLGTPPPSRPSYLRRDMWTGRTGVRPLPLRQGPEGLPCGLHMGGSAPSPTSYTLFPLAGNSRPPRHLRFLLPPLGFHTLAYPGTDTPSASAARGRQGGGRRDTKAEPGAKVKLAPFGIGGWGKRASSGFLTPMVFQVTTRGGQVGRYIRESRLSRK